MLTFEIKFLKLILFYFNRIDFNLFINKFYYLKIMLKILISIYL